jgi:hypothetical protein
MVKNIKLSDAITSTPTVAQIVSTSKTVDEKHKIVYFFECAGGDPIGEFWTTQAMVPGVLVKLLDNVHAVQSLDVDWEQRHIICNVGPILHFQPDGTWHHLSPEDRDALARMEDR